MNLKDKFCPAGSPSLLKGTDIYDCMMCGKMYTTEQIDIHLAKCPKVIEYLAAQEELKDDEN
tara:strand:- start:668 stop:853 length:186 start_codon:yes stop_codon:yes gene_type:complete